MKKIKLTLLLTLITFSTYSQISFEKGYFINNDNQKITCLIKNVDWASNPESFEYKNSENSEIKKISIKDVKEFCILNVSKFIRANVEIDISSESANKLSKKREPIFKNKILFLKVLIEGKTNLYMYKNSELKRFFYNQNNSDIKQLVYKRFVSNNNNLYGNSIIGKNNFYKQQIWNKLKCNSITRKEVENTNYSRKSLLKLFKKINNCSKSNFTSYNKSEKRKKINFNIRPRLNSSSLSIDLAASSFRDFDFKNVLGLGVGLELEYIFPFNKNKWSLAIEPTFQSFKSEKTKTSGFITGGSVTAVVDYKSLEVPLSIRHYFFLNNDSKLFINASYVFDFSFSSNLTYKRIDNSIVTDEEIETQNNLAFGFGYKLKDKYSIEIRYLYDREVLGNIANQNSNYSTISLIFGYTLFNK